ncbi:MAG: hypothetical protein HYV27_14830 [Candidatus Hydrogenedentes bacterium]|nr:hypothetical protein [Candidatus Hydrogenedentota bacterium]
MAAGILAAAHANAASEEAPFRQVSAEGIRHSFLVTGTSTTALVSEACEIVWEVKGYSHDGYVLENGNILVSDGKVAREYRAGAKDVLWSYTLAPENKELGTVQRLDNGDTMLVERGPKPRILEVGQDGAIKLEVPLQPDTTDDHMQTRMARKLPTGNYLVPHLFAFKVKEYTPAGEVVREIPTDLPELGGREEHNWPFTAILLENGNVLVDLTHGHKTVEFDPAGKVAWRCGNADVDGQFNDPCGAQRLPNGNTVIGSYGQTDPSKPRIFEVTRNKKVVWEFYHPEIRAHEIHILTTNGVPVKPVLR